MNVTQDIDTRIDAALAAHVRAPRLDRQFDAAVWRRIEAGEGVSGRIVATPPPITAAARWLSAGNFAGLMVAAILLGYYAWRLGSGVAPNLTTGVAAEDLLPWLTPVSWAIAAGALAFGLKFTALGRWLKAELS
jgi:hypothetical protein